MIKSLFKLVCLMVLAVMLAACQTASSSKTTTLGPNRGGSASNTQFDHKKAAQKRLAGAKEYFKRGNLKKAKRHLDRALELDARAANIHFALAYYYALVKEFSKAEKFYKKALRIESGNPDFQTGYATFLCHRGKYKKADKYFKKAIKQPIYPEIASAFVNAGICAKRAGHIQISAAYFRKALNRNAKLPVALIEMAESEFGKKRYQRAFSYILRYEAVARSTANSLWLGLRVSHYLKDKDALASYALKLEQLFPDSDETADFLDNRAQWM